MQVCENCEKNDGKIYSIYWIKEDQEFGHFVCLACETEFKKEWEIEAKEEDRVHKALS